jgi:hypothetical protein
MRSERTHVIKLFKEGKSPQEIIEQTGKHLRAVLNSLDRGVFKGEFKSTDILFAVDESTRAVVTDVMENNDTGEWTDDDVRMLSKLCREAGHNINEDDLEIILRYHSKYFRFGDLYEDIRTIETTLYRHIERTLKETWGTDKWFNQIPSGPRDEMCKTFQKADTCFEHPFQAAHLPFLFKIIEGRKSVLRKPFDELLQGYFDLPKNKKSISTARDEWFKVITDTRNRIMHPIGPDPTVEQFTKTVEFRQFVVDSFERNQQ